MRSKVQEKTKIKDAHHTLNLSHHLLHLTPLRKLPNY